MLLWYCYCFRDIAENINKVSKWVEKRPQWVGNGFKFYQLILRWNKQSIYTGSQQIDKMIKIAGGLNKIANRLSQENAFYSELITSFFVDKFTKNIFQRSVVIAVFSVSLAYILGNLKLLLKELSRSFYLLSYFIFWPYFLLNTLTFTLFCFFPKENVIDEIVPNLISWSATLAFWNTTLIFIQN